MLLLLLLFCMGCSEQHDHQGRTPLVELEGNFLYREDLQAVLPSGLSGEDSASFAERYVRSWIEDILLYDRAQRNIPNSAEIDRLVENYRKTLIMHTYQQALMHQKLEDETTEEELEAYYDRNQDLFKVERPLMKGLFIKVPLTASGVANVRRWYKVESQETVERLEKYQMQHAVKYEYFYDKWVPVADVLGWMPLKEPEAEDYLNKNRHVELKDTAFYYFLNVSDYRAVGESEPYEFARKHVKDMLLNVKQVEFMKQVKDDLYERAVRKNEIKYY